MKVEKHRPASDTCIRVVLKIDPYINYRHCVRFSDWNIYKVFIFDDLLTDTFGVIKNGGNDVRKPEVRQNTV